MNLQANKTDGKILPLSNRRISADEWNQLAASCMAFITAAGLTPDALDNEQLLNAFKAIAADLELVGANTNLSNLSQTGENHFVQLKSGVAQADADYVVETYKNGNSWYRLYKSGWCEQGGLFTFTGTHGANYQINLLKPFVDTSYSIVSGGTYSVGMTSLIGISVDYNFKEVDSFKIEYVAQTGGSYYATYYWLACGYAS